MPSEENKFKELADIADKLNSKNPRLAGEFSRHAHDNSGRTGLVYKVHYKFDNYRDVMYMNSIEFAARHNVLRESGDEPTSSNYPANFAALQGSPEVYRETVRIMNSVSEMRHLFRVMNPDSTLKLMHQHFEEFIDEAFITFQNVCSLGATQKFGELVGRPRMKADGADEVFDNLRKKVWLMLGINEKGGRRRNSREVTGSAMRKDGKRKFKISNLEKAVDLASSDGSYEKITYQKLAKLMKLESSEALRGAIRRSKSILSKRGYRTDRLENLVEDIINRDKEKIKTAP